MKLIEYKTVGSTSWVLKEMKDAPEWTIVCADFQTSGHGQATNKWESEKGANLLFSILLKPHHIAPSKQFIITKIITLAIYDVLQPLVNEQVEIKWPNDIYIDGKKVCGILVENSLVGLVIDNTIIGVGINLNQTKFVSDAPNPVSLKQLTGREYNPQLILNEIVERLRYWHDYSKEPNNLVDLHERYFSHLYRREGYYKYMTKEGEIFEAKIGAIGEMGHLHLITKQNEERIFAFKEVIFK